MRIGVVMIPTDPWPETMAQARRLDSLGFDHLWVYDHLSWRRYRDRPWHATYPWLAAVAAVTERIRLGTMVSNPNIRHPYLLAKDAMTIDHVAGGRLVLGIGAGGSGFDETALGGGELAPGRRMDRFEEFVGVVDELLRGQLTDHSGEWYEIDGARMLPGCVQQPRVPLALAAGGRRGLRTVAERADAWVTLGDPTDSDPSAGATFAAVRRQTDILEAHCEAIGRDPDTIDRVFLAGHGDLRPLRSLEAFDDAVGNLGELGVTDLVVHHPRADDPAWDDPPGMIDAVAPSRRSV